MTDRSLLQAGQQKSEAAETGKLAGAAITDRHRSRLKHYVLSFLAFFGIYAASSVCPFCGRPGCPVGAGGAVAVGGLLATLWHYGLAGWRRFRRAGRPKDPPGAEVSHAAGKDRQL